MVDNTTCSIGFFGILMYIAYAYYPDVIQGCIQLMEPLCVGCVGLLLLLLTINILGFTPRDIAAGSVAAFLMSLFATLNGGGITAGSLFASIQSIGAVGLVPCVQAAIVATIGAIWTWFTAWFY